MPRNARKSGALPGHPVGSFFRPATRFLFSSTRILLPLLPVAWACSSHETATNRPPTVELTAGPTAGDTVRYSVPISWAGQDPDGSIARYEYAVDPPAAF